MLDDTAQQPLQVDVVRVCESSRERLLRRDHQRVACDQQFLAGPGDPITASACTAIQRLDQRLLVQDALPRLGGATLLPQLDALGREG